MSIYSGYEILAHLQGREKSSTVAKHLDQLLEVFRKSFNKTSKYYSFPVEETKIYTDAYHYRNSTSPKENVVFPNKLTLGLTGPKDHKLYGFTLCGDDSNCGVIHLHFLPWQADKEWIEAIERMCSDLMGYSYITYTTNEDQVDTATLLKSCNWKVVDEFHNSRSGNDIKVFAKQI